VTVAPAVQAHGLGKRFRRHWALRDCTLEVPAGRVVGLVGVNGAGKTTLLHLLVGLTAPTEGRAAVLGGSPAADAGQLGRVGFLAQSAPLYPSFSIADHLRLGKATNPGWDAGVAAERIESLCLDPRQRAGQLSGGQRAQVALTLALAKRPELLVLDEPVSSLDPLARRGFLQTLMAAVADQGMTVVLSSHLIADLERVCDHVVVLAGGRVRLAGDVEDLLAGHRLLSGPRRDLGRMPEGQRVVQATHSDRQTSVLVRTSEPVLDPAWSVASVGLEDLVLAYMASPAGTRDQRSDLAVVR
jgi:ABC-2 type transport system ATP-binding protein